MRVEEISSSCKYRVIISGGGTGGHFYPAVAIAERLKERYGDDIDILFVGAYGKMEMEKVPLLGWKIIGLNIAGLQRRVTIKNLSLPFKVIGSYCKSKRIIKRFKPQVAIGSGGYVTLPIIGCAARNGVKTMIWEGNSHPGMANRRLASGAYRIFVPHNKMTSFFDKEKVVVSGVPLRGVMNISSSAKEEGYNHFSLEKAKPTLFVTGGSLGTMVFNRALAEAFEELCQSNINLIWQCGSQHYTKIKEQLGDNIPSNFYISPFIDRMDLAYNVADVIISRAGASSLAELALTGSASIVVPSSWVPDNHQEKNAMVYVESGAAIMIKDQDSAEQLIPTALSLLKDDTRREELKERIKSFAEPNSADIIANEVIAVLEQTI